MQDVESVKPMSDAEITAQTYKIFQEFERVGKALTELADKLKTFRSQTVSLVNLRETLGHDLRQAEIRKGKIEEEVKIRLESVSRGHQVLIDRISKREIELSNKQKEVEAKEALLTSKLREAELLLMQRERELEGMKAVKEASVAVVKTGTPKGK